MTDRLQRCIEAGSVVALFPLLKDWPEAELRALIRDARRHYAKGLAEILKAWNRAARQIERRLAKRVAKVAKGER